MNIDKSKTEAIEEDGGCIYIVEFVNFMKLKAVISKKSRRDLQS